MSALPQNQHPFILFLAKKICSCDTLTKIIHKAKNFSKPYKYHTSTCKTYVTFAEKIDKICDATLKMTSHTFES